MQTKAKFHENKTRHMSAKALSALIDRCYFAIDSAACASYDNRDLRECVGVATSQERQHRRMGERFTGGSRHAYALSAAQTGRYFACRIVLGEQPASTNEALEARRDYQVGWLVALQIAKRGVEVKVSSEDRGALLAVDYAGDIAL